MEQRLHFITIHSLETLSRTLKWLKKKVPVAKIKLIIFLKLKILNS